MATQPLTSPRRNLGRPMIEPDSYSAKPGATVPTPPLAKMRKDALDWRTQPDTSRDNLPSDPFNRTRRGRVLYR